MRQNRKAGGAMARTAGIGIRSFEKNRKYGFAFEGKIVLIGQRMQ